MRQKMKDDILKELKSFAKKLNDTPEARPYIHTKDLTFLDIDLGNKKNEPEESAQIKAQKDAKKTTLFIKAKMKLKKRMSPSYKRLSNIETAKIVKDKLKNDK